METIAFTRISFVYYQGNWYWTSAYVYSYDMIMYGVGPRTSQGTDWNPDWQTRDAQAPASSVYALPAESPGPFTVRWSGSDAGPSGIESYDVQVKEGASGAWTDWQVGTTVTSASYPGIGGYTYYFRVRARDNARNIEAWPSSHDASTTVEALPPISAVDPLPAYSRGSVVVGWSGGDPGGSGIQTYDVQHRDGITGTWTDWQTGTVATLASFAGVSGHTYYFRSRAVDYAQNIEDWTPGDGNSSTTFYAWGIIGTVRDNTDVPVAGALITTTPKAFTVIPSDISGSIAAYVTDSASVYAAAWGKGGYGNLPATTFDAAPDGHLDTVLPPANNVVNNWDFEMGSLGIGWTSAGIVAPAITDSVKHTGGYAALLGQVFSLARPIHIAGEKARDPQVAVDKEGIVHIIWEQQQYSGYGLYYTQRRTDGTWLTPEIIAENLYGYPYQQLVTDDQGLVHVVFVSRDIFHMWRDGSGFWSNPQNISNSSGGTYYPDIAVDDENVLHVVWVDEDDSSDQPEIYYAWRAIDGIWASRQIISGNASARSSHIGTDELQYTKNTDGESIRALKLGVDDSNSVHVIWQRGDYDFYYARRNSGGAWSSPSLCMHSSETVNAPVMAVSRDGDVHLVWSVHVAAGENEIFYTSRNNAGNWSTPTSISGSSDGFWPQIAISSQGNVHVTWVGYKGAYHAWKSKGGNWSDPYRVGYRSFSSSGTPGVKIAVDENEVAHLIWWFYDTGHPSWNWPLYYARWSGGIWSTPLLIRNNSGSISGSPEIAVGVRGGVDIVWNVGENIYYIGVARAEETGDSTIAQAVSLPVTVSAPILSFFHQFGGTSITGDSWFEVQISNDTTTTTLFSSTTDVATWSHRWFDLSPWANQTITVAFNVHQTAGNLHTWAYLDEVSIGSTYPDLWISKGGGTALPGEQVTYNLAYGNQGGAPAGGVRITETLPTELLFVGADPPPTVTTASSVVWDVGDLAAKSGPFHVVVTVTVAPTATVWSTLTNTASIAAASPELETANNTAQAAVFIGRRAYLPLVMRNYD